MPEWIDFVVYTVLILAVWGWLPAWSSRFTIPVVADRNPDWIDSHPELERRLGESRWFVRSCLLWGALSLAALLAFQLGTWPEQLASPRGTPRWEALKDLNSLLLITGLIYLAGCSVFFYRWLHANVPLAPRRQATLERRSSHDYIPRAIQYAIYGVVILHLGLWVAVGVTGRYATPAFWGTLVFQFAISGVFLLVALGAVRRRPSAMDRIFGPSYRRTEVRLAFAAQLLPLMNGAARLYEQVTNTPLENVDRFLHLGLVLLVIALGTGLAGWSRAVGDSDRAPWSRPAKSAGALVLMAFMTMRAAAV